MKYVTSDYVVDATTHAKLGFQGRWGPNLVGWSRPEVYTCPPNFIWMCSLCRLPVAKNYNFGQILTFLGAPVSTPFYRCGPNLVCYSRHTVYTYVPNFVSICLFCRPLAAINPSRLKPWSEKRTRRPASADRTARRQFQDNGQPVSRTQASDAMTSRLPHHEAKCVQPSCFQ